MAAASVEIPSSHVAMVSHPDDVTQLIETAARAVLATSDAGSSADAMTTPST
jgi:hypothetical protein